MNIRIRKMKKAFLLAVALVALGSFAAVPFKIGIAGYTFNKKLLLLKRRKN